MYETYDTKVILLHKTLQKEGLDIIYTDTVITTQASKGKLV